MRGNLSLLLAYGQVLERFITAIQHDIEKEVLPIYQQIHRGCVQDGLFSNILVVLRDLIEKYAHPEKITEATKNFAEQNSDYVFKTYEQFKKRNSLRIDWQPSVKTRERLDEAISQNVDLIKTIPKKYLEDVKKEFSKATAKGWDMQQIHTALTERHGVTQRRAFNMAVDQQNKVINAVSNQVNKDAGIVWVKWIHRAGVKKPRHSHVMADGTIFDVRKGCFIDEEWIMPGQKINCHCFSVAVIPIEAQRRSAALVSDAHPFKAKPFFCRAV
ncbi:phage minor head protein [Commensalibacter sp. Nvir]|uniref:phage minor head protein n=1 Tax=Commensalibacter sp. Nvir TaxID=3069817 RepID=UPI0030C81D36